MTELFDSFTAEIVGAEAILANARSVGVNDPEIFIEAALATLLDPVRRESWAMSLVDDDGSSARAHELAKMVDEGGLIALAVDELVAIFTDSRCFLAVAEVLDASDAIADAHLTSIEFPATQQALVESDFADNTSAIPGRAKDSSSNTFRGRSRRQVAAVSGSASRARGRRRGYLAGQVATYVALAAGLALVISVGVLLGRGTMESGEAQPAASPDREDIDCSELPELRTARDSADAAQRSALTERIGQLERDCN